MFATLNRIHEVGARPRCLREVTAIAAQVNWAATSEGDAMGRSFARSEPAPGIWHGFFTIAPSRTAVVITARKKRYDCMMDVRPPLPRIADAYHSRTTAGVSARNGTSRNGAKCSRRFRSHVSR